MTRRRMTRAKHRWQEDIKKGHWMLRKYLYFMSMRAIYRYYERKLKSNNRFGRPLRKTEAICAVSIKLIKVIFALLRDESMFCR